MGRFAIDEVFNHLKPILKEYSIPSKGIIHVGAHDGQEVDKYKQAGFKNLLMVEPLPQYAQALRERGLEVAETAIGSSRGKITMYVTEYDQASSFYKPLEHTVSGSVDVSVKPLDDITDKAKYNCLVVDTQGAELEVLKSGDLSSFDLIIYEGSNDPRYENAADRHEIGFYLNSQGFYRQKTFQHQHYDIYDEVFVKSNKPLNIIIAAGGQGTRWDNYHDIPKHLIQIEGESLLERTVRQFKRFSPSNIYIVGPDDRYDLAGTKLHKPRLNEKNYEADKFLSYEKLWRAKNQRTLILFGDVYFSDEAVETILSNDPYEWYAFGRAFESKLTGKKTGEMFGIYFDGSHAPHVKKYLKNLINQKREGAVGRIAGWELYKSMIGIPVEIINQHLVGGHFINIDDWSDDFDYPQDYERWIIRKDASVNKS